MGRKDNCNITNYHYRADIFDDNNTMIASKYYYTLNDVCREYHTSTFTVYRIIKDKDYKPTTVNLKGVKIYKDYKPAIITTVRPNLKIYGELDDLIC